VSVSINWSSAAGIAPPRASMSLRIWLLLSRSECSSFCLRHEFQARLESRPLIELGPAEAGNMRPLFRGQISAFVRDADEGTEEKIRRFMIQSSHGDQPAEIDQMMHPAALFWSVLAHHQVTTGFNPPRRFADGTGPK
jgi:hypothetical protein